jgi:HK97 family phage major capsid protein
MGNSLNVPSITTGSAVAAGTAENSAITNTDLVTGSITAATQTISGQTKASYQLIDLSQAGMDNIILDDISRDYTQKLDNFALNSSTTNAKGILQVSGTNAITYTDASPTVPELFPFVFQGKSAVEKSVFAGVDFVCMHPSTWNWYLSALDSNNRPLALSVNAAAFNADGGFEPHVAQGLAGNIAGLPVITDANVPVNLGAGTNQAPIVMVSRLSHDFWEGVPQFAVADQTLISQLTYVFVLYGYAAQMSRQAAGASVVNGTGLIVQSGF